MVDARKEKKDPDAAWQILGNAESITAAKGKKIQVFNPGTDGKADILKAVMGPSGNLRAPTLQIGDQFIVGFNADLYDERFRG